jgi:hypothetical protein
MRNVGTAPLPCNRDLSSSGVAAKQKQVKQQLANLEAAGVQVSASLKHSIQCAVGQHQLTLVWDIIRSQPQPQTQCGGSSSSSNAGPQNASWAWSMELPGPKEDRDSVIRHVFGQLVPDQPLVVMGHLPLPPGGEVVGSIGVDILDLLIWLENVEGLDSPRPTFYGLNPPDHDGGPLRWLEMTENLTIVSIFRGRGAACCPNSDANPARLYIIRISGEGCCMLP